MAAYNKIGFLAANIGQGWADFKGKRFGLGDYVRMLDEAGIPIAMACNDGTMGIGDVLGRIEKGSKVPHVLGYRIVAYDNKPVEYHSVPNYLQEPKVAARNHYNLLLPIIKEKRDLPKYKEHLWWFPVNEVRAKRAMVNGQKEPQWNDMHAWDWMGEFCYEFALMANADGYKVAMPQANSGEPHVKDLGDPSDAWKEPGMRKFLKLCAERPNQVCVGLHEYSWELDDIWAGGGGKVGRFEYLFRACDEMGIARPNIIFGEWGWKHDSVPRASVAIEHIRQVAERYARHPQILGAFIWYLGPYNHSDQVNKQTAKLLKPLAEATLQWRFPDPEPNGKLTIPSNATPHTGGHNGGHVDGEKKEEGEAEKEKDNKPIVSERPKNGTDEEIGEEIIEETTEETVFDLKFASKSHDDAAGGWFDLMNGKERLPIQVPNEWTFDYVLGANEVGDPDYDWGMPETRFMWDAYLPEHEHEFLLNDAGHTYKIFAAHRPIWSKLRHNLTLQPGKYKVTFTFVDDTFTDFTRRGKTEPGDEKTAESRIILADQSTDWVLNKFLDDNVVILNVEVDKETKTELILENRGRWAVKNNGVFLQRVLLEKVTTKVIKRSKWHGLPSQGNVEVSGGTAVMRQTIQPLLADVNALRFDLQGRVEDEWQTQQSFTIPFSGQETRLHLTFLKEAILQEGDSRKYVPIQRGKSSKKWPFGVLKPGNKEAAVPTTKPLGIDVSFHQGNNLNWAKLKKDGGVKYAILRVGSGVTEKDANYERNVRLCLENEIPFGNYFYLQDESFVTPVSKRKALSIRAQARRFVAQADWRSTLPPVVDVEEHKLTAADVKAFIDEFHQLVDAPPIMIYTRANLWNKIVPKSETWPKAHPLWVAHYGADTPTLPHHWDRCLFHQTSQTGQIDGYGGDLDTNLFYGKLEELTQLGKETAVVPYADSDGGAEKLNEGSKEVEEKTAVNPLDDLKTRHQNIVLLDIDHVTQRENRLLKDCGPACVAMLAGIDLRKALDQSGQQDNKAFYFRHLTKALGANKISTSGPVNLNVDSVRKHIRDKKPAILLINYDKMPPSTLQLTRRRTKVTRGGKKVDGWNTEFDHFVVVVGADDGGLYFHDPLGLPWSRKSGGGFFTYLTNAEMDAVMSTMSWGNRPNRGLLIEKEYDLLLADELTSCYAHQDYLKVKGGIVVAIGRANMRSQPIEASHTFMKNKLRQKDVALLLDKKEENGYLVVRTANKGIMPTTDTEETEASKPTGKKVDMTRYFFPPEDKGEMGDIYLLKNSWSGGQERVQLQRKGDVSFVVKNSKYEKRTVKDGKIYLDVDTSPGPDDTGKDRYYTVTSETGWMPQEMAVGERFTRQEKVTYYYKENGRKISQNDATSDLLFVKHHENWTSHGGRTLEDVVELAWEVAKGDGSTYVDERYFFAAGYGLVGWHKHSGEKSWITNEDIAGQSNNKMEEIGYL